MKAVRNILSSICICSLVACGGGDLSLSKNPATDTFTQNGSEITAKMDILWVVDNSGSMYDNQVTLKNSIDSFINSFVGKGYDFKMAVIATDAFLTKSVSQPGNDYEDFTYVHPTGDAGNYCFGRTITASSQLRDWNVTTAPTGYRVISSGDSSIDFSLTDYANPLDMPANDVRNLVGINVVQDRCGTGAEQGLASIKTALETTANKSTHGFFREDAHLAIIMVSDEEDHELKVTLTNPGDPLTSYDKNNAAHVSTLETFANDYHNVFQAAASPVYGYSFYAATISESNGLDSTGCEADESTAEIEFAYSRVAELSGGGSMSLCEADFSAGLENIAQTIIERTTEFKLEEVPEDSSALQVSVKNPGSDEFVELVESSENGWTYNPAPANSLTFHGTAVPEQGAELKILYVSENL